MQRFLAFLVDETLAGRASQLKEYTVAISVFGKAADFDPSTSPVVRVEAGRLRRRLMQYRVEHGRDDAIVLEIPTGSYVPTFRDVREREGPEEAAARPSSVEQTRAPDPIAIVEKPAWSTSDECRLVTVISCAFGDDRNVFRCTTAGEFIDSYDAFHEKCTSVANRYGGTVDSSASDRLIVYFGWPDALEDAAGRALTTALEMLAAIRGAFAGRPLGVRIGVATSEVVTRAGDASTRPAVIGEAPFRATKILQKVPLNGILVAESTRRLTGASFDFIPAGSAEDQVAEPGLLWRLLRARSALTRFHASHGNAQPPIIGRQEEVALLTSRWRLSAQGEGQGIVISGEAGIGKSRLAEAVLEQVKTEGAQLRVQCSPHHSNSTLYPVIELIRNHAGLSAEAEEGGIDEQLDSLLARFELDEPFDRAVLAGLLSGVSSRTTAALPASQKKEFTLKLLTRMLTAQVRRRPTVLLVEDIHWADPTTLELLQDIFRLAAALPLMVLATSRQDLASCFATTNVTLHRLTRLSKQHCNELVDRTLAAAPLSPAARSLILEKAEGIPLFLEELTKLLLVADENHFNESPIPHSLSDLLASRLNSLGASRSVAQVAAVIGRQFTREMLVPALGFAQKGFPQTEAFPQKELDTALDQLLTAGIIVREGADTSNLFSFRHALFRDAAYGSIIDRSRRDWHYRVASVFTDLFPEVVVEHPEIVARHLMDAGRCSEAIPLWLDAGRKAAGRYALAEAITNFRMGLKAVKALANSVESCERELEVLTELGVVIRTARGYGDEELLSIYQKARALAAALGKQEQLANTVFGLWTYAAGHGNWQTCVELATEFESLSRAMSDDDQLAVETFRLLGASSVFRGDFAAARRYFERALSGYDAARHSPRFGFDPGAISSAYLSWTVWHLGEHEEARACAARALSMAEAKGHAPTSAAVLTWLIFYEVCEKNIDAVLEYCGRLRIICLERDYRHWQAFGAACAEWAAFQHDADAGHLERMLDCVNQFRQLWGGYFTPCLLLLGADLCRQLHRSEQGLDIAAQAQQFIRDHGERMWDAECSRLTAELLLQASRNDSWRARQLLQRAIKTAHDQEARALEQRAINSLGELDLDAERAAQIPVM